MSINNGRLAAPPQAAHPPRPARPRRPTKKREKPPTEREERKRAKLIRWAELIEDFNRLADRVDRAVADDVLDKIDERNVGIALDELRDELFNALPSEW